MPIFLLYFALLSFAQSQDPPSPKPPVSGAAPVVPAPPASAPAGAPDTNLLGKVDSASGESRRNENVQFNQIDNNGQKETQNRMGTAATAIIEFKPDQSYFGAEFGNKPGGQIHLSPAGKAVTRPHFSLYETHGDSAFTARSFFQSGGVKPARTNQYGFQTETALWKNSFLSLSGSQDKNSGFVNGNILVPLPSERTILAKDPAAAALLQRFLKAYRAELPNRTDIDPRALNTNAPQAIGTNSTSEKLDQKLNSRDRLVFQHTFLAQKVDAFQFVAGQNPNTTTRNHEARITWLRAINPRMQLQASTGFDRNHTLLAAEPNAVGPTVSIGTAWTGLGPASTIPIDRAQNRFRQAVSITRRQGSHSLVAGGEFARLQFNGRETSSNRGTLYFRNDFGNDAITNFRLGLPNRASLGIGALDRGFRYNREQFFFGDNWSATRSLTVNLGLRYLPLTAPSEVNNRTQVAFPCACLNAAPALGLALRLPKAWGTLRANYDLAFGEIFNTTFQQLRWNPPDFLKVEVQAPNLLNPYAGLDLGPTARAIVYRLSPDLRTPYSHQYNFQWEVAVHHNWKLQAAYAGSRTWKLFYMDYGNRALPTGTLTTANVTDRRPDPRYFDVRLVQNPSRAYFDSARATLQIPGWHGLSGDASYWFSKAIDTGGSYTNTAAGDDITQGYSQSENLVAQDLKGLSSFDQSHAVLVRLNYGVPGFGGPRFRSIASRWQLSNIWLAKTGLPFTVFTGSDSPGFGNVDGVQGDRPNILDPTILGRTIGNPDTATSLLPRSAFSFIRPGEMRGNIGVSTFRRGGIRNMNASLTRTWAVRGDWSLAFRAEAINLMNTPQFAAPVTDLTSPAFGKITNTLNDGRTFRFSLRLSL